MLKQSENMGNYGAKLCRVDSVHEIIGKDRIQRIVVGGFNIVADKSFKVNDIVVFFPMECCICNKLLNGLSLYRDKTMNSDPNKKGFFETKRRVTQVKFGEIYSQGFVLRPDDIKTVFDNFDINDINTVDIDNGYMFNMIDDEIFCEKYIPVTKNKLVNEHTGPSQHWWKKRQKKINRFERLIDGQFTFHYDTGQLANNLHNFLPSDKITLTTKIHGSSIILSNTKVKRKFTNWEKIKRFFGVKISDTEFDVIYSTRKVPQNGMFEKSNYRRYYDGDVHGAVFRDFKQFIPQTWTIYGEVCGYIEGRSTFVQKNHDYGCEAGEWKFMPYRITQTNEDGSVWEFPVYKVIEWTEQLRNNIINSSKPELTNKLMTMNLIYRGTAGDMYGLWNEINKHDTELLTEMEEAKQQFINDNPNNKFYIPERFESLDKYKVHVWRSEWLDAMKNDKSMIGMELKEPLCKNNVPREGVVIRKEVDVLDPVAMHAYKLKSDAHYNLEKKQHDAGETDIEEIS